MKIAAGITIAAGILIAGAGGLCTWLATTSNPKGIAIDSLFGYGLLPIVVGVGLIGAGTRRWRDPGPGS